MQLFVITLIAFALLLDNFAFGTGRVNNNNNRNLQHNNKLNDESRADDVISAQIVGGSVIFEQLSLLF